MSERRSQQLESADSPQCGSDEMDEDLSGADAQLAVADKARHRI